MWVLPIAYSVLCASRGYQPPPSIICGLPVLVLHFYFRGVRLLGEETKGPLCPSPNEQLAATFCVSAGVWAYRDGEPLLGMPLAYLLLSGITFVDYINTWEPGDDDEDEDDEDPPSGGSNLPTAA